MKDDAAANWSIIGPTIRAGETYALAREMSEAEALSYWMGSDRETFVAVHHYEKAHASSPTIGPHSSS